MSNQDGRESYQEFEERFNKEQEAKSKKELAELDKKFSKEEIFERLKKSKNLEKLNEERNFWGELAEGVKTTNKEEKEPDKPKSSNNKPIYSANFEGLIELVEWEGKCAYLVQEPETKEFKIVEIWEENGKVLTPPPNENIPFLLPRGSHVLQYIEKHQNEDCKEDQQLYLEILNYHKNVSELPDEDYYDLLTIWDFHTYLIEQSNYSPIICFFAVAERGKSRTGKGSIYIARRGVRIETVSDAHIIRMAQDLGATLFFDCMDLWKEAEKAGSRDVLLNRFEKGMKVPRVLYPEKGAFKDTVYYEIFGPTIIATNEPIHQILDTRTVPIIMQSSSKRFEQDVTPEIALPLKEQLVAWRAVHLKNQLPEVNKVASLRMGDILRPLHQIIKKVCPERELIFLRLVKKIETDRLSDKSETLEAEIVQALIHLKSATKPDLEEYFQHGKIATKDLTDYLNNNRTDKEKLTYHLIGKRLKALGFRKGSTQSSASAIYWDESKIEKLKLSYGLNKSSETSDISDLRVAGTEHTDNTDVTSVPNANSFSSTTTLEQLKTEEEKLAFLQLQFGGGEWAEEEA